MLLFYDYSFFACRSFASWTGTRFISTLKVFTVHVPGLHLCLGCCGHEKRKHHLDARYLDTGYIRHIRICNNRDKITPNFSLSRAKIYMPPKSGCDTIFWHMCVVVAPAGQSFVPWCIAQGHIGGVMHSTPVSSLRLF